jgi:hypothetical protein
MTTSRVVEEGVLEVFDMVSDLALFVYAPLCTSRHNIPHSKCVNP